MLGRLFSKLASSQRAQFSILSNGFVSVASLVLSIAMARNSTIAEFAAFALALAIYLFLTGLIRAAFTDTALAVPEDPSVYQRGFRRGSLVSVIASILLIGSGLLTHNMPLIIFGLSAHGLAALDVTRTVQGSIGNASRGLVLSLTWAAITIAGSVLTLVLHLSPYVAYLSWAVGGALIGYLGIVITHSPIRLGWPRDTRETNASALFSFDYLVGSGGSSLTTTLVGTVAESTVIASLRGAGALLGPANLIASTASSLILPILARAKDPRVEFRVAVRLTLLLVAAITPVVAVVQFIPDSWGRWLLKDVWTVAHLALLPLAFESVFALVSRIPAAGHRAAFAGRRTLLLRLSVGVPRPFIVVTCALLWGIPGATWSMAVIAIVNSVLWWASYRILLRNRARTHSTPASGDPQ